MKKFSRLIVLIMVVVMAICVFAACNPHDGNGPSGETPSGPQGGETDEISVTFNMSGEGENVVKTGKAGDALEAPALQDGDYYFGGWHLKQDFSDDAATPAVFPERNVTYYAEWDVEYVFAVMLEQEDGSFLADAQRNVSGRIPKGSTDSVTLDADEFDAIEGFALDNESYTVRFAAGQRDSSCEVKYMIETLTVTYVTGIGDNIVEEGKYGALAIGEDRLGEFEKRHFIGWSKSENGEADYVSGDAINEKGELTLYAVWEIGLADILGGDDTLYVSKTEQNVVYLERYALDEPLKGTLDGDLFSVKVTGSFTLDGVKTENGFYYFKDTLEKTYKNKANEAETLEFVSRGKGKAIHHTASGDVEGKYEFDPESSCYTFVPASGTGFLFKLSFEGETSYFERADENVRGSYIIRYEGESQLPYIVFDFDGFGGIDAHCGDAHAEGSYEWDADEEVYYVALDDEEIAVRFGDDEKGTVVDGCTLKGSLVQRDGVQGSYGPALENKIQKDRDAADDLTLDGFGKGTYKGEPIQYDVTYDNWYEENPYDEDYYGIATLYRVTFTYQGKSITLCIEDSLSYNDNFYIPAMGDLVVEYFADASSLGTIYESNGYESYDNSLGVFMYKYGKGDGAIVSVMSMYVGSLTGTSVCTEVDWGVVTQENDDTYHFVSTYEYFGKTNDADFEFQYLYDGDDAYILVQLYDNELHVSDKLKIDKFGYASYMGSNGDEDINYVYDPGFNVSFITFPIVPDDEGTHTEVYMVNFDEEGNITGFTYLPDFHMITDTSYGCSIAMLPTEDPTKFKTYIGFPQDIQYYYVIAGTATLLEGTANKVDAKYSFEIDPATEEETTKFLEDQGEEVLEILQGYYSFKYIITDEKNGECGIVHNAIDVTSSNGNRLQLDEDGTMTLTTGGKSEIADSFAYMLDDMLVLSMNRDGVIYHVYVALTLDENGAITEFAVGGEEANQYYSESVLGSGLEDYSRVFILFGNGKGVMTNAGMSIYTVYEKTNKTFEWNDVAYTEYKIGICYDSQDEEPDIFYYIAVTTEDFNREDGSVWHGGKYKEKTYSEGTFDIVGGGSVSCNGYDLATYTNAEGETFKAAMHYVDIFDRYFNEATYPDYPEDDGPTDHIYIAYYDQDGELIEALLFDITADGKLDERDGFNGVFAEVVNNAPSQDERYIYLDGQGNVIVYDGDDKVTETGKYRLATELGENFLEYTPDDATTSALGKFVFWLYRMDGISCYIKYNADNKGVFYGANGELLITDGFAQGIYRDKYGVVKEGLCTYLTDDNVVFTPYGEDGGTYFSLDAEHDSFELATSLFVTEGTVLVRYNGTESDIPALPSVITEIAAKAFQNATITSINLGNVTKIGDQAFEYCENLETVIAPNVVTVGRYAFAGCYALEEIELPLVETIGESAFEDAPLNRVKLSVVTSVGQYAFSHENNVMTIFDLTDCTTLDRLEADDEAFRSRVDGAFGVTAINMKAYVGNVAALNRLISNKKASEILKNTAGLNLEDDPMNGAVYIGFADMSVYLFDGGTIILRQNGSSRIYGVYAQGNSGVDLYVRGDDGQGIYEKAADGVTATNILTLGQTILFKNTVSHNLTSSDKHSVTFAIVADANASFDSLEVTATFDGQTAASAELRSANGKIRLSVGQGNAEYYDIQVLDATTCEVTALGNAATLATADKFYQLVGFVKDGKITDVSEFGFHSGDSPTPDNDSVLTPTYSNRTISDLVIDENGAATFDWWYYSDEYVTFTVKYLDGDSIEVTLAKWTFIDHNFTSGGSGTLTFTISIDNLKVDAKSVKDFSYASGFFGTPQAIEITNVTEKSFDGSQTTDDGRPIGVTVLTMETANGTYEVTVTAQQNPEGSGGMITYSASYKVSKVA